MTHNYSPYPPGHEAGPRLEIDEPRLGVDMVRLLFTYVTAIIVVVGGGMILFATRNEPTGADLRVIAAGFIGSALTFLFGQEVQTRTARQAATATAANTAATTAAVAAANSGVGTVANGHTVDENKVAENTAAIAQNTADIADNTDPNRSP